MVLCIIIWQTVTMVTPAYVSEHESIGVFKHFNLHAFSASEQLLHVSKLKYLHKSVWFHADGVKDVEMVAHGFHVFSFPVCITCYWSKYKSLPRTAGAEGHSFVLGFEGHIFRKRTCENDSRQIRCGVSARHHNPAVCHLELINHCR